MLPKQLFSLITLLSAQLASAQFPVDCQNWFVGGDVKITDYTSQCNLTDANYLYLFSPNITSIPPVVFKMTSLTQLIISSTNITRVPSDIGKLKSLTRLDVSYNLKLRGPLPESIYSLRKLRELTFDGNRRLDKGISTKIGQLTELQFLSIANNALGGTFPSSIGALKNLTFLGIQVNKFTGDLPAEIGQCTKLRTLSLVGSNFSGKLPDMFSKLTELDSLGLANNNFEGPLPTNLSGLIFLDVSNTKLSGPAPEITLFNTCLAMNSSLCRDVKPITFDNCGPLPLCPISKSCQSDLKESQKNYIGECKYKVAPKTVLSNINETIVRETVFNVTQEGFETIVIRKSPEVRPSLESIFRPLCTQSKCSKSLSKNGLVSRVSRDCAANPKLVSVYANTTKLVEARSSSVLCHTSSSNYRCATEFINLILTQYPFFNLTQPEFCTPCFIKVAANLKDMEYVMRSFGHDAYFASLAESQRRIIDDLSFYGRNSLPLIQCPNQTFVDQYYVKQSL